MKSSIWDFKMPYKTSTNCRTVMWYKAGMCIGFFFFLSDHCIKQIDSLLPSVRSVTDHTAGRQNVLKTSVTHSPAVHVQLLCFYHILTSSVIYY